MIYEKSNFRLTSDIANCISLQKTPLVELRCKDTLVFWGIKAPRLTSSKPPFPPRWTMQRGLAHPQMRAFQEGRRYVVWFCCPSTGPLFKGLSWASPTEATPFWFKPAGRWASPETALLDVLLIWFLDHVACESCFRVCGGADCKSFNKAEFIMVVSVDKCHNRNVPPVTRFPLDFSKWCAAEHQKCIINKPFLVT